MITRQDYKDFPVLMVEFLNYMDAIRNKSKNTISEYASDLRLFFRFLKIYRGDVPEDTPLDEIDISDIDKKDIRRITLADAYAFLSWCKDERDNSARTRARKVSTLRAFFKYCTVQKHPPSQPQTILHTLLSTTTHMTYMANPQYLKTSALNYSIQPIQKKALT